MVKFESMAEHRGDSSKEQEHRNHVSSDVPPGYPLFPTLVKTLPVVSHA